MRRSDRLTDREIDVLTEYEAAWLANRAMPYQRDVASLLGISTARVSQIVSALRLAGWFEPGAQSVEPKLSDKAIRHLESFAEVAA